MRIEMLSISISFLWVYILYTSLFLVKIFSSLYTPQLCFSIENIIKQELISPIYFNLILNFLHKLIIFTTVSHLVGKQEYQNTLLSSSQVGKDVFGPANSYSFVFYFTCRSTNYGSKPSWFIYRRGAIWKRSFVDWERIFHF